MRDVVERKQPGFDEITHLGLSLPIEFESAETIIALIEGDNGADHASSKLRANGWQSDMRATFSLVVFAGEPNACVWIIQDRIGPRRRTSQHRNSS